MAELIQKRTYTSKTHGNPDGSFTLDAYGGHIHYDNQGQLEDVDLSLEDMGTYWQMKKTSYKLYINKAFGGNQLIRFDNRFEGANHTIYYTPHSVWFFNADNMSERTKIKDAQVVSGFYDSGNRTVTWTNAFGNGVHFQVTIMRHGFKKEIVVDSKPNLGTSPYANYYVVPVFKWEATGLTVKAAAQSDWDEYSYYEHSGLFEIKEVAGYKSYIRQAHGIDADGRRKELKVIFEKRGGALWQGKLITKNMLDNATFPVRADTITDYTGGAGDGFVRATDSGGTPWDTAHDKDPGDGLDEAYCQVRSYLVGGDGDIARACIPIDTSALPDNAVISAAVFWWYVAGVPGNGDNDGDDWLVVVQTTQSDPANLATSDFAKCGDSVDDPTEGSNRLDIGSVSGSGNWNVLTLDATGRGWISKTTYTLLGVREGHDVLDNEVAGNNTVNFQSSEGANPNYLKVTYTVPGNPWYFYEQQQ